jgi:hypothetical protein
LAASYCGSAGWRGGGAAPGAREVPRREVRQEVAHRLARAAPVLRATALLTARRPQVALLRLDFAHQRESSVCLLDGGLEFTVALGARFVHVGAHRSQQRTRLIGQVEDNLRRMNQAAGVVLDRAGHFAPPSRSTCASNTCTSLLTSILPRCPYSAKASPPVRRQSARRRAQVRWLERSGSARVR